MQPIDRTEFARVLNGLAAIKRVDLTPEALGLWWLAMARWTLEDFKAAATELVRTLKFMPGPNDFEDLRKAGRMTPGEAWALALTAWDTGVRNVVTGEFSGSTSGDPLVDAVVRMIGGYSVLAKSTDEQLAFIERRFCEHYETLQDSADVRGALPQIADGGVRRVNGPSHVGEALAKLTSDR